MSLKGEVYLEDDGEYLWVPVQEPALYFGLALKDALTQRGIQLSGDVIVDRLNAFSQTNPLFEYQSPPLPATLAVMNKESDNYSAEYVLRRLGVARSGSGTSVAGLKAVSQFLRNCGVESDEIMLVDGCGLARRNLCSARGLIKVLAAMDRHESRATFMSTLSVAGVDGTLSSRMSTQKISGRVRAKTGTMTNVSSLAGYLTLSSGEDVAFAILCNNFRASRHLVRSVQDKLIERIFEDLAIESPEMN
jgi:D-alanyl-D-alanine carboxypeptidase/D-alanyl-D-alanine-endopeptidase (penicillin-binding protein 4)